MGKKYAQLSTPDGSEMDLSADHNKKQTRTHNRFMRTQSMNEIKKDLEDASEQLSAEPSAVYIESADDEPGCDGMFGRCPYFALTSFVACGILIGIGVSQLLVCRRSETEDWCKW